MPNARSARPSCSAGQARLSPEVLFGRLKNLENQSARELTAV